MEVVLINCYSGNPLPVSISPFGLLYVGSALKRAGHRVDIYDRHIVKENHEVFCERFLKKRYDIYGLGGISSAYLDAIQISKWIKEEHKEALVIVGGYLSSTYKVLFKNAQVDVVVHGEGEITAVELLKYVEQRQSFENVQGISFIKNGDIIRTKPRKQIVPLDQIPFPDYTLIDMEKYLIPAAKAQYFRLDPRISEFQGKLFDIITSRGCINFCTFCYRHMYGMRCHSPEYVLKHIKYLQENYGVEFFNINDELTISDINWAYKFCELKKKTGMKFLFRINSARVDLLEEQMLASLKEAGMVAITFGIESGSQTMLEKMRKNTLVRQNLEALRLCAKLGIQTTISMIVGMPGENFRTVHETAGFLRKCPHPAPNIQETEYDDMSDIRIFTPVALPGTVLYQQGLKMGVIKNEHAYLCSIHDNIAMRSYNFTSYPQKICKWWLKYLYFVYRSSYFYERRQYWDWVRILLSLIVWIVFPKVIRESPVFKLLRKSAKELMKK